MGKALIIVAIIAALAYMYFFNDMRYHINFTGHREDQVLHQAGTDDSSGSSSSGSSSSSSSDSGSAAPQGSSGN